MQEENYEEIEESKSSMIDTIIRNASNNESVFAFLTLSVLSFVNIFASKAFGGADDYLTMSILSIASFALELVFFVCLIVALTKNNAESSKKAMKSMTVLLSMTLAFTALIKLLVVFFF